MIRHSSPNIYMPSTRVIHPCVLRSLAEWIPFLGRFISSPPPAINEDLERELPPARVAIIGAGMGGCFSAKFLRELGGRELDIHIWNKQEGHVGGRAETIKLGDHWYEAGAGVAHTSNQYLVDAVSEYGRYAKLTVSLYMYLANYFAVCKSLVHF